jgi:hypothetical protein
MTSAEMLKSKIKANEYFHNKASFGKSQIGLFCGALFVLIAGNLCSLA